jgi:two-component system response regulator (stage 0 sporulation protein F)
MAQAARRDAPCHTTLAQAWIRGNPPRVLLADDDETLRTTLADALRRDGFEVIEACDGAELTELVASGQLRRGRPLAPDVIVTDIAMPGLSGLELLRRLRGVDHDTPVILITGLATPAVCKEARQLGVAAFFRKPFDLEDLETVIANLAWRR